MMPTSKSCKLSSIPLKKKSSMSERNSKKRKVIMDENADKNDVEIAKQELSTMTSFIFNAITLKQEGNMTKYNELFRLIGDGVYKNTFGLKKTHLWVLAFSRATQMLDCSCRALVNILLKIDWVCHDNNLVVIYVMFLANLITSHSDYIDDILNMLVKHFVLRVDKDGTIPDDLEFIHGRVHYALKNVLPVVPSGEEELIKIIFRNFPYKKDSLVVHVTYLKNILQMLEYLPALQTQVLELIFERLTDLDTEVQGKMEEIESFEDSSSQYDISLHSETSSTVSSLRSKGRSYVSISSRSSITEDHSDDDISSSSSPCIVVLDVRHLIEKLDCMLKLLLDYLKWFFDNSTNEQQEELFDTLMTIFEKIVLLTFKSRYTQFLIFWYVSLKKSYVQPFLAQLLHKLLADKEPPIIREVASQYVASYIGRAAYLSTDDIRLCVRALLKWAEKYLDCYERLVLLPKPKQHKIFYTIVQCLMYIFCFRWKDFRDVTDGMPHWWPDIMRLQRIIKSKFAPLQVCSGEIVKMFIRITEALQFMNCKEVLGDRIYRDSKKEFLDMNEYFPFDPFRLKTSRSYISSIYQDWKGIPGDYDVE
ncbi:hypothetical protein Glove_63g33 [Diversispora epigaea]|uniref:RNA polymerase I-specific transcription initiation factor RRN3 n=1 Tax=Diversispora epigaea TaxID=1348612 RepID=A0A397JBD5_9GLOM|nr:hypothetical protein Glove_63g33 [Diversispora epigaea]